MSDSIRKKFQSLGPPSDCKLFLSNLKKILEEVIALDDINIKKNCLHKLVELYLECPSKFPVKRLMASFFQNLVGEFSDYVEVTLCEELIRHFSLPTFHCDSLQRVRHLVDTVGSLLENFKMGEKCINLISMQVLKYLVQAETFFLSQIQSDMAIVLLHQTMQHCHVTIQTINLVLQKTVSLIAKQLLEEPSLMSSMLDFDLQILNNETFLLDCRCCCSMNAVLLLQLAVPSGLSSNEQIASLLFPKAFGELVPAKISWVTESQAASLNMDNLSILSYLAMSFGYIAMVSETAIRTNMSDGHNFYLDCLLPNLLEHGKRCNDTASKSLFGKTISLWSSRLHMCLGDSLCETLVNTLSNETRILESLLDYVWTHWEDQLDVIRQSAKSVFENVLKIHIKIAHSDAEPDLFIATIMEHLFSVSWTCKGKFSALTTCVRLLGARQVLSLRSKLPSEIVDQLEEQALACYSSELYSTLFITHHQELKSVGETGSWEEGFFFTWLEPVVKALCSNNSKLKQNLIEYLLVKLMKQGDEVLQYLITRLSAVRDRASCGAVIMCLRKARTLGLFKAKQESIEKQPLWYGYLHPDVLKSALCSFDQQVRLDAFGLLCENHKTTEPVSHFEFTMLKFFIPCNLNNQSPAFRQSFLSLSKKFFSRSKESLATMRKHLSKNQKHADFDETIQNYQKFYTWLTNYLLSSLYPGSAFARRTTSLAMLSLLTNIFGSDCVEFSVTRLLSHQHIQVLLECISDTFEENKKEAFNILSVYMQQAGPLWNQNQLNHIFEISMMLACSTRPQDCETAVYNFLLILKQQELHADIFTLPETLSNGAPIRNTGLKHPVLNLLNVLLDLLDDEICVANQSLITAAATRPMYPTLLCIRYIMPELNYQLLESEYIPFAKNFILHLIQSCQNLAKIVSPVVQNSSPEGNMPENVLNSSTLDMSDLFNIESIGPVLSESTVKESQILVESMPEYLVVCCWRSIKEVSLTLGKLCLQVPVNLITEHETLSLLTFDQVKMIGDYFSEQLLESIHRGAFELAYAGFQLMCQMLWSHPLASFNHLPIQWLTQVMLDIKSEDSGSKFCITRRSAGIPFFIQAITSTEPVTAGRKCFHQVMNDLLALAVIEEGEEKQTKYQDSQIHAVNILGALYRDARLGEDVLPYVADGLKASVLGFKSELWAIRNSATLLLSSLMTRIFGVKRSKDETDISKKNCQSGRTFFHQYPSLYTFLLSELKAATDNIHSSDKLQLHPSLYPVLLVLGRLYPSTIDNPDTNMSLSAFIPFVIKCASSPVYKTRIIASLALLPLVRRNEVISISQTLLANIPESYNQHISNSLIHGSLLQLCQIMTLLPSLDSATKEDYLNFMLSNLSNRTWLISSQNSCWATWQLMLNVIDCVLEMTDSKRFQMDKTSKLWSDFVACLCQGDKDSSCIWKPMYISVQQTMAKLCFKYLGQIFTYSKENVEPLDNESLQDCKGLMLKFLHFPFYEVRLCVLDALLSALDDDFLLLIDDEVSGAEAICTKVTSICESSTLHTESSVWSNKMVIVSVAGELYNDLMEIGLNRENYHLCLEKVYSVLASVPHCAEKLMNQNIDQNIQLFGQLLEQMDRERRLEVKAAIFKFSAQLVPVLYDKLKKHSEVSKEISHLLMEWTQRVKSYCKIDDSPVLQVSCCHALMNNVRTILLDSEDKLGSMIYNAWDSLACLLQEDDLDVKDIAASILCAVCKLPSGEFHPSYALACLPSVLLNVHGKRDLNKTLICLIGWIMEDSTVDVKESSERLFDKGEMNTYLDTVNFTRFITTAIRSVFGDDLEDNHLLFYCHSETAIKWVADPRPRLDECLKDAALSTHILHNLDILRQGLECLLVNCLQSDQYLNVGRYLSLCTMVFKAKTLLQILSSLEDKHPLDYQILELKNHLTDVVVKFDLKNMLAAA
ncbi:thyroid adenoma-associated protein homolog [Biomphalaria glabrata]|uniref:tRNA (32-2'-O)-methyltransferase regulator THADA n=1 Tax=Biomphalaria glabrata TaxID=6526 RepID=A0A9W3A0T6_BIOGL|nr:thyroid adenoma-associated protein homolog [Biomphalaria glabrata]XP_055880802.1 thyroid adenoma-associated protein homolog [Biomphalaria glabrata]